METFNEDTVEMEDISINQYSELFLALNLDTNEKWPSSQMVQAAFKENVRLFHPDKGGDTKKVNRFIFNQV